MYIRMKIILQYYVLSWKDYCLLRNKVKKNNRYRSEVELN